jgi:hypothetical protein
MSFVDKTAAINLVNDFPVTDADGLKNEPFTFTVTNNCNKLVALGLGVESLTTSTIDSSHIKASIVSEGATPTTGSILTSNPTGNPLNGGTAYIVLNDYLNINQSKSYDLRLWLDYNTTAAEASGKVYNGKAIVTETAVNNTLYIPKIVNNTSQSSYASSINLSATLTDSRNLLNGVVLTSSSTEPSSASFTTLNNVSSYNYTKSITSNGTYYLWARNKLGITSSKQIVIDHVATLRSVTMNANELSSSSLISSSSATGYTIKAISSSSATYGTISGSPTYSGSTIYYSIYPSSYSSTCSVTEYPAINYSNYWTDGYYTCSIGNLSGSTCIDSYDVYSTLTDQLVCTGSTAANRTWKVSSSGISCSGNCYSSCNSGYSYQSGGCSANYSTGGSCSTQGATKTGTRSCSASCYYSASATYHTTYYCQSPYEDYNGGCYYCSTGYRSGTTCIYNTTASCTKYQYNLTIYYWT